MISRRPETVPGECSGASPTAVGVTPTLGAAAILRQHPHTCPNKSEKSPAPRFHTASKAAREALRKAYGLFLAAFREAAERLKGGDRTAMFPNGCFPPGLPFVRA